MPCPKINKHNIDIVAGHSAQETTGTFIGGSKRDVPSQNPDDATINYARNANSRDVYGGKWERYAIESYFLESAEKKNLTHGEAIAVGMVIELYYSSQVFNFPMQLTEDLKTFVNSFYGMVNIKKEDLADITDLIKIDKILYKKYSIFL